MPNIGQRTTPSTVRQDGQRTPQRARSKKVRRRMTSRLTSSMSTWW
jgi:hypothetical protein